jgi:para-nitrobenzyl esterase
MGRLIPIGAVAWVAAASLSAFADSPRLLRLTDPIRTDRGYIAGTLIGDPAAPVRIYRGIPYAAPPVGDLRWRPPQPPAKWSGIRETVTYGTHPVQFSGSQYPNAQGEDSLYLNVLTPVDHPRGKLPVMVWFHGGGLTRNSGNDSTWNYHRLPQHGVVVVTVSTRLGPLGLLAHPALSAESPNRASGNYMYLDLIAALNWVQRNIGEFGGDPGNVTIWGQSGGGWKVGGLMTSPLAKGLFHRAIMHSGGGPPAATKAASEAWGQQFFGRLGVTTLEQARALPWEALAKVSNAMPSPPGGGVTVDGFFLEDTPINIFKAGRQNAVPLLVTGVTGEITPNFNTFYVSALTANLNKKVDGFAAVFNQVPANWRAAGVASSFHSLDLPYVFGVYDDPNEWIWRAMSARAGGVAPLFTASDKLVSESVMKLWAEFARTGDPGRFKSGPDGRWPAWTPAKDQYLYLDQGLQIRPGFSRLPSSTSR